MSSYVLENDYERDQPPPFHQVQAISSLSSSTMATMTKTFPEPPPPPPSSSAQYPLQPTAPHISTPPSSSQSISSLADQHQVVLPKVGQTRCYWALLSSDLHFIYFDPVLCYHLGDQQESLVGKPLLSFVHPDEQASAKRDLGDVLDRKTLYGSVTRVRFLRLSSVRRHLGYQGPPPFWAEAEKIVHDETYMAVELAINWAADGLVLCFIHASVDINAIADNDERTKTGWTNWCGTPWMPQEQIELLYHRLLVCVPQPGSLSRVFQILSNEQERPLLLSWPPESAHGPNSREFSKLVENVQISSGDPGGSDAKTSCTRRHKASQDMPSMFGCQVESIFIPHGTIIFACHKVHQAPRIPNANNPTTMNQVDYGTAHYVGAHAPSYYDHGAAYSLPSHLASHDASYSNGFVSQQHPSVQSTYSSQRWSQVSSPSSTVHNVRSTDSYPVPSPSHATQPSWSSNGPSPNYTESGPSPTFDRPASPNYTTYSSASGGSVAAPSSADVVPPPRRRISPSSARDQTGPIRSSTNRPSGVLRCSSCKTTSSPEWRKGPSGKKELCNACGLRYARSRAKKEGHAPSQSRRRKEKASAPAPVSTVDPVKRESNTPPMAPSYSAARRGYAAAISTSAPSASETYSTNQVLKPQHSPSPSPPASTVNYVSYPGHDGRSYYPSTAYYSAAPSPLAPVHTTSHPDSPPSRRHPLSVSQNQEPPTPHTATSIHPPVHLQQQLPPLQRLSSYVTKVSSPTQPPGPNMSPHSTASNLSVQSSYERGDRSLGTLDREIHLPPTPLSADPRNAYRRSILTLQ